MVVIRILMTIPEARGFKVHAAQQRVVLKKIDTLFHCRQVDQ